MKKPKAALNLKNETAKPPTCPFSGETGEFLSLVKPLSQGNPTVHFGGSEDLNYLRNSNLVLKKTFFQVKC